MGVDVETKDKGGGSVVVQKAMLFKMVYQTSSIFCGVGVVEEEDMWKEDGGRKKEKRENFFGQRGDREEGVNFFGVFGGRRSK